jgi:hypothetical protein
MATDEEFPPLLEPGLQKMSTEALMKLVVSGFPESRRRPELWKNLLEIIEKIKTAGLTCEIWVDGSFLTSKLDPDDVDFVVDFPIEVQDSLSDEQAQLLEALSVRAFKKDKKLHSFVMFTANKDHPDHVPCIIQHEQWQKDFGLSYIKKEPKGIAVLTVQP